MDMSIGEKITFFRKRKGFSQEQIAEILNMTPQGYGKIERNETDVAYSRLELLSKTFGIKVEDLVGFGEKDNFQNGSNSNFNVFGNSSTLNNYTDQALATQVEKSGLIIESKDKEISALQRENALLEREIENLKEIVALLKENKGYEI